MISMRRERVRACVCVCVCVIPLATTEYTYISYIYSEPRIEDCPFCSRKGAGPLERESTEGARSRRDCCDGGVRYAAQELCAANMSFHRHYSCLLAIPFKTVDSSKVVWA